MCYSRPALKQILIYPRIQRISARLYCSATEIYWVPGVNHLAAHGRWAFAEFTQIYRVESDFRAKIAGEFGEMIEEAVRK